MTQHGNPTRPQIHDALVDVPGGRVFTRRWSVPVARHAPLVLLHDSLGCVALWRDFPLELAMACHCDVLAYDRLGFGKSSARKEKPSLQFIHEEAATFFPALQQAGAEGYAGIGELRDAAGVRLRYVRHLHHDRAPW